VESTVTVTVISPGRLPIGSPRRGHFGAWRTTAATPAMVGSLLLLLVLFGWMGRWEGLVLIGWLTAGAALCTRCGERLAVAVGCGFRRPSPAQLAALEPAWTSALARSGLDPGELDLYVQRSAELNAYATGARSVAVTTAMVSEVLRRRRSSDEIEAVVLHELGHHASGATRFALASMWLALPWRFAARTVIGLGLATVGRRQPMRLLAAVVMTAVVVAVVQAIQQRQVAVALVLASVALCAVVCPFADAWIARRSEYAADRFAAHCGAGAALVTVLVRVDRGRDHPRGWTRRLLSPHPPTARRVAALQRYTAIPAGPPWRVRPPAAPG
jgi:Zn-dependent protease with chaperone function